MKVGYFLATIPVNLIGKLFLFFDFFQIKDKLDKCINVVDEKHLEIPESFISYLISAEDHRSECHYGIDQVGILRAIFKTLIFTERQGASTIEQQFVRVVTNDYSYTLLRKFKEQLLAVLLSKKRNKINIARAYLAIAYYGYDCEGTEGISAMAGSDLQFASESEVISIMARLKYPKPLETTEKWQKKFTQRVSYIKIKHQKSTNKARQRMLRTAA